MHTSPAFVPPMQTPVAPILIDVSKAGLMPSSLIVVCQPQKWSLTFLPVGFSMHSKVIGSWTNVCPTTACISMWYGMHSSS